MSDKTEELLLAQCVEISSWLKLAFGRSVRRRIVRILDSDAKLRAFEATDGSASSRDIGALAGVDQKTIVRWWDEWAQEGLVEPGPDRADRPKKLVSPTDLRLM